MELILKYKSYIIISLSFLLLVIGCFFYFKPKNSTKENNNQLNLNDQTEIEVIEEKKDIQENIMVDIKGYIKKPGVYTMKDGDRVIDVIKSAGGLTNNASTLAINLSKKIYDQMVIIIHSNEEIADFKKTNEEMEEVISSCNEKDHNISNNACISKEENNYEESDNISSSNEDNTSIDNDLISINLATKEELMTLPGIGEKKANDIINYRENNGNFAKIEDIMNVSGIGESTFAQIKDYITI